jgi:hypothetical protein
VPEYEMQGDNDCPMFVATGIWGLREFAKDQGICTQVLGGLELLPSWDGVDGFAGAMCPLTPLRGQRFAQPIRKLLLAEYPIISRRLDRAVDRLDLISLRFKVVFHDMTHGSKH